MKLQAVLEKDAFEALEEPFKDLYKFNKDKNTAYLDLSADEAGKLAFNLQHQIESLTTEKEKLAAKNEEIIGEKRTLQERFKELEAKKGGASPDLEELNKKYDEEKAQLKSSYDDALKAERDRNEAYKSAVGEMMKSSTISKLRADFNLNETAEYVLKDHLRVVPEKEGSDNLVVRVFENGQPAFSAGEPKTPEMLLSDFRDGNRHLAIFNSPNGGGTGGSNAQGQTSPGKKQMKRSQFDSLSPSEQMAHMKEGGTLVD